MTNILFILFIFFSFPSYAQLIELAAKGTFESVKSEITKTNDISVRDKNGFTPLMMAATYNSDGRVTAILANSGINVNARTKNGISALMLAAAYTSNSKVIKALINFGADTNARNKNNGANALMIALAENKKPEIAATLMNTNINLNAQDKNGNSALFFAIKRGDLKLCRYLLEHKPSLNIKNKKGETALIYAAKNVKNPKFISVLIKAGSPVYIKDNEGFDAKYYAEQNPSIKNSEAYWELNDAEY